MPDSKSVAPSPAPPPADKAQPFFYARPSGHGSRTSAGGNGDESGPGHSSIDPYAQKAYEKGLADGKAAVRADFEKEAAELRSQISAAVRSFSKDRADYFARVETEVVRLSLSIARKILHRESQIDPLVLTGVVHVALQKLNGETSVTIRARHDEVRFWKDYFKQSRLRPTPRFPRAMSSSRPTSAQPRSASRPSSRKSSRDSLTFSSNARRVNSERFRLSFSFFPPSR